MVCIEDILTPIILTDLIDTFLGLLQECVTIEMKTPVGSLALFHITCFSNAHRMTILVIFSLNMVHCMDSFGFFQAYGFVDTFGSPNAIDLHQLKRYLEHHTIVDYLLTNAWP